MKHMYFSICQTKTIEKIGKNTVTISTQGQEKLRVSCLIIVYLKNLVKILMC